MKPQKQSRLVNHVRAQLKRLIGKDRRTIANIALDASVPVAWLTYFIDGKIPNPGTNRMEHLYEYVSGKPLKV